jgi:chromosome segregation ATPase
MCAC